jgi:capsid protein
VQDVAAQMQAVRGGLTSLSAVVAEASGEDAETVLRQIAEDNALADRLGLRLDSDSRQTKGGTK